MFRSMHYQKFVQEHIYALTIFDNFKHKLFFRKRNKWVVYVSNPEKGRLTTWQGKCIKLNVHVIGNEAYRGVFWVLHIVKTHFYRLDNLRKKANWKRELTHINYKYKSGTQGWSTNISGRCFEFICTKLQFLSFKSISSLTEFIQSRLIWHWNLIHEIAQVAFSSHSIILEWKIRIDVGLTSLTSERSLFSIVNIRDLSLGFTKLIIVLSCFC